MKLMIAITPRNKGEHITQAAKKAGCGGATIILGTGTAKNQILELLGLGTSEKDLVYIKIFIECCNNLQGFQFVNAAVHVTKLFFKIFVCLNHGVKLKVTHS